MRADRCCLTLMLVPRAVDIVLFTMWRKHERVEMVMLQVFLMLMNAQLVRLCPCLEQGEDLATVQ